MRIITAIGYFATLVSFVTAASAQAPIINSGGVVDYDLSTPMQNNYYWSIYGSNLSSGSGTTVQYYWEAESEAGGLGCAMWTQADESATFNTPSAWYESSGQINFFFSATDFTYNNFNDCGNVPPFNHYLPDGKAQLSVTNSDDLITYYPGGSSVITYQP